MLRPALKRCEDCLIRRLAAEDGHEATTEHHSHITSNELMGALHTDEREYIMIRTAAKRIFRQSPSWSHAKQLKLIPTNSSRMTDNPEAGDAKIRSVP
jgi:hypothetical protein